MTPTPTTQHWKSDLTDLKSRAMAVAEKTDGPRMTARQAAAALSGIMGLVTRKWTLDDAQRTCAELVRHEPAWETAFGRLPHANGFVGEPMQLIATVARSLLPIAGADHLRAALSFWASESDPLVWQSLVAA